MGSEAPSTDAVAAQKPVICKEFPDPTDADFDDDISEEEKKYYMTKFKDLNQIKVEKLHCTACDRHMGCAARNDGRMRSHPMLRTLVCRACHAFYNSGEFERGDDGSELYCRWCGQGGQVYCCSSCPIVFCAKCVRRNFSSAKIKEIESVDDWKCFKCVSGVLWDLRATCWALLRYCDLKNKLAYITEDPELKEKYQKACLVDDSECCKKKKGVTQGKKKDKLEEKKQEEKKQEEKKQDEKKQEDKKPPTIVKRMPEIHIKKFAHQDACFNPIRINKRPGSPLYKKITISNAPIPIAPGPPTPFIMSSPPMVSIPQQKKIKLANIESLKAPPSPIITKTYTQRKIQKPKVSPMLNNTFNGFQAPAPFATLSNDTINLSLDSLTQGLDITAVNAYNENPPQTDESTNMNEDDVVCTPDFPLEPLCEVSEDNNDDDVECITPGPLLVPRPMPTSIASTSIPSTSVASTSTAKVPPPPPLVPRISQDDIVQMTDNDVTINKSTGGLKFRVDPQTLSANKMYRLPDGRVFAINANPNMPGGYSATIVAVAETNTGMRNMPPPSRVTYAAKLSTVIPATPPPPPPPPLSLRPNTRSLTNATQKIVQTSTPKVKKTPKIKRKATVEKTVDLKTPVEWYRYNLVDAADLMSYVLKRLNKLKANAETTDLRKKNMNEMKFIHKSFDQLLKTSITRFTEVKENLNQGFKEWTKAKSGKEVVSDDDVEILGDEGQSTTDKTNNISADSDDPIFIDENSNDSVKITCDDRSNGNGSINAPTIVISDRSDNINQDTTVPVSTENSETALFSSKPTTEEEMETSPVLNLDGEEVTTDEKMDTESGKDHTVPSDTNDTEVKDSVCERVNDPTLPSNRIENVNVQVDPVKSNEDTKTDSPINSEVAKIDSAPSSPIPHEEKNNEATENSVHTVSSKDDSAESEITKDDSAESEITKDDSAESDITKDDSTEAQEIKLDAVGSTLDKSENLELNNGNICLSQTEISATSDESAIKVNGENSTETQNKDNDQVDIISDEDKNNTCKLPVEETVLEKIDDSSEISDKQKKGAEIDSNNQGSDGGEIKDSKVVNSDLTEDLDDESLGKTVTSINVNVATTDTVVKEVKLKATQDLEIVSRDTGVEKMDIDLDLNEEELLNGDKTEKGDGDRDDVAISDELINDLLDDNLGPSGESKIPNLNIPCQP